MSSNIKFHAFSNMSVILLVLCLIFLISGCGKDKEVVRYVYPPSAVLLVYPLADSMITSSNPTFIWHKSGDAVHYHLQVGKTSDFVNPSIDTQTIDTTHTAVTTLSDDTYYWRVRCQDQNGVWGDWSDAEIRIFYKSGYVNYFNLLSQTLTNGISQDVFVRGDSAYVADGQADLSIYDITNRANPRMALNINTGTDNDFAKGVFVIPATTPAIDTFPFAYVADMDGWIQALNTRDAASLLNVKFGSTQNTEDFTAIIKQDTIWFLAVTSGSTRRKLLFEKVFYDPEYGGGPNPATYSNYMDMPASPFGVCTDTQFVYVACGSAGLVIVNVSDIYNPYLVSTLHLSSLALSVDVKDSIAYVACDRGGLYVVGMSPDRHDVHILHQVNTVGRTKDVQVVGNYAFIADADGGLKAVDVTIPAAAHVAATYATPYAYGLYADPNYIYVCDRDLGLLIFTNRVQY